MSRHGAAFPEVLLAWADLAHAGSLPSGEPALSEEERRRLAHIAAPRRAAQFIAGRALARGLLLRRYGDAARHWTLSAREGEAPRVLGHAHAHLSLSHASDIVACALADMPVGLDLERLNPRRDRTALLEAIATPEEQRHARVALASLPSAWLPLHLWCLKEACIKVDGGTLFNAMLGKRIEALPVPYPDANAMTWRHGDVVVAIVTGTSIAGIRVPDADLSSVMYWRVRMLA